MPRRKDRKPPKTGSTYSHNYKGQVYVLKVVEDDQQVAYSLKGKVYKTPTAAAKSITKSEINGWRWWGID